MKKMENLIGIIKDNTVFDIVEKVGDSWKLESTIYDLILSVTINPEDITIKAINRCIEDYKLVRAYDNLYLDLLPELERF